jgi:hypothetical protein
VNGLWTSSPKQLTSKGIHPGNAAKNVHGKELALVKKAYPKAKCGVGPFGPQSAICDLTSRYHGRRVITSFVFYNRENELREIDIDFA